MEKAIKTVESEVWEAVFGGLPNGTRFSEADDASGSLVCAALALSEADTRVWERHQSGIQEGLDAAARALALPAAFEGEGTESASGFESDSV
jgi:hypothetical protein